jgi:hypothetical protein
MLTSTSADFARFKFKGLNQHKGGISDNPFLVLDQLAEAVQLVVGFFITSAGSLKT